MITSIRWQLEWWFWNFLGKENMYWKRADAFLVELRFKKMREDIKIEKTIGLSKCCRSVLQRKETHYPSIKKVLITHYCLKCGKLT